METSYVQVGFLLFCLVIFIIMFCCGQVLKIHMNKKKTIKKKDFGIMSLNEEMESTIKEASLFFKIDDNVYTIHVENDEKLLISREDSACDVYVPMSVLAVWVFRVTNMDLHLERLQKIRKQVWHLSGIKGKKIYLKTLFIMLNTLNISSRWLLHDTLQMFVLMSTLIKVQTLNF